jgi:hypothetical protein
VSFLKQTTTAGLNNRNSKRKNSNLPFFWEGTNAVELNANVLKAAIKRDKRNIMITWFNTGVMKDGSEQKIMSTVDNKNDSDDEKILLDTTTRKSNDDDDDDDIARWIMERECDGKR